MQNYCNAYHCFCNKLDVASSFVVQHQIKIRDKMRMTIRSETQSMLHANGYVKNRKFDLPHRPVF